MDLTTVLLIWTASIAVGTIWGAASGHTTWWVGAISTVVLGPIGLLLIAADVVSSRRKGAVSP